MSEAQKRAIYNLSRRRGISVEDLEAMVADEFGTDLENLSSSATSTFIRTLQQAAYRRELFREALDDCGWIPSDTDLKILPGRRYLYKGLNGEVAIDGSFSSYEYLWLWLLALLALVGITLLCDEGGYFFCRIYCDCKYPAKKMKRIQI